MKHTVIYKAARQENSVCEPQTAVENLRKGFNLFNASRMGEKFKEISLEISEIKHADRHMRPSC
jgi:hypothetical protein